MPAITVAHECNGKSSAGGERFIRQEISGNNVITRRRSNDPQDAPGPFLPPLGARDASRPGDIATVAIKGPRIGIVRPEFEYEIPIADAERMLSTLCQDDTL